LGFFDGLSSDLQRIGRLGDIAIGGWSGTLSKGFVRGQLGRGCFGKENTMRRSTGILSFVGLLAVVAIAASVVPLSPRGDLDQSRLVAVTKTAPDQGDVIALRFAGRYPTRTIDSSRDSWTGDIVSLATSDVVGTLNHEITCHGATSFPCVMFQSTDTFTLPGGTITSRSTESVAPVAAMPGFFHVGIYPESNSIISATGAFEGRTGRAILQARHDGREYPGHVTFEDFWVIELDPKA
jgi:hypothetical protein